MKQRYVYIIRRGESILATETRAAKARTLFDSLKDKAPDRPQLGYGEDALEKLFSDLQKYDAQWHLEKHPMGPPILTDKDK